MAQEARRRALPRLRGALYNPSEHRSQTPEEIMFEPDEVTKRTRSLRTLWYAMMMGVALYSGVVWFLLRTRRYGGIDIPPIAQTYAAVIIILALPLARVARKKVEAVPPQAPTERIIAKWVSGWIVGQAIREAVGLAGITLGLLNASIPEGLAFCAASVGSMLLAPPWEHELRLRLRRMTADPD